MDNETLRKVQNAELEILKVVDRFCRDNDINYSLYAGTALGAVRHGGFIPWDDDIDICMDRNDYNRFLKLWRENPTDGYTLSGDDEQGCRLNHSKVQKDYTLLASDEEMKQPGHHGIWLDIFALDKAPTDKKKLKKFIYKAKLRLIYTRDYPYKGGSKILELASRAILFKPKKRKQSIKRKLNAYVQQYKDAESGFSYMGLESPDTLGFHYPEDIFDAVTEIRFEGCGFSISSRCDEMLTVMYGDYMQLPPEEDRVCKHNPEVISFDTRASGAEEK